MQKDDIGTVLASLGNGRYWYQRIEMGHVVTPVFNGAMSESAFYNRGKWDHFIRPLFPFPIPGKRFVECGCNAGLFLLLAAEAGFSEVVGLEGDDGWIRQARFIVEHYRKHNPQVYGGIELLHGRIGEAGKGASASCNIETSCNVLQWSELPTADLTLLANVLYWIEREAALRYVSELAQVSTYAIVVSVNGSYPMGGPCSKEAIRHAFQEDWQEIEFIASPKLQAHERGRDMFSILYRSRKL